ncbi:MAG: hypothetical protein HGB10_01300 [Coriobacteriia bacterium]|nr:hypothetical protein [Coriobacteriia bacterium]
MEAIGLAVSLLPIMLPGKTPRDEAQARIIAAHDAAVAELAAGESWSAIQPVDESFLAWEENWVLIVEEALSLRTDALTTGDLNLSRFDNRPDDSPELAEAYLAAFRVAQRYDLQLSTLREATKAAQASEALVTLHTTPREEVLQELVHGSNQRMTTRCIAAGVESAQAPAFASLLLSLHVKAAERLVRSGSLKVVVAPVGAGKSTFAESVLQYTIQLASSDVDLAPVWLDSHTLTDEPLHTQVGEREKRLGGGGTGGTVVIVDGLDELDLSHAERLLNEARAFNAITGSTCLLTTRPLPLNLGDDERTTIETLEPSETSALVSKAANREVRSWEVNRWPPSIREATKLPLFALLMGLWLRENPAVPATTGELVQHLVRRGLPGSERRYSEADEWLMHLAVSTTASARAVAPRDLPHTGNLASLTDSGLVEQRDGQVSFPLALLQEWFAARAILKGAVDADELASAPEQLSRWRGALRVLLELAPTEFVDNLLSVLVRVDPGLVGELLGESASPLADRDRATPMPDADKAGTLLRHAMIGFHKGLGPLGDMLVPVASDGEVQALGVSTDGPRLDFAWLAERPESGDVIETKPGDIRWDGPSRYRWTQSGFLYPGPAPAWPWRTAQQHVRKQMTALLRSGAPFPEADEVMHEAIWNSANVVLGRGAPRDAIGVQALEELIQARFGDITGCPLEEIVFAGAPKGLEHPLALVLPEIERLRAIGEENFVPPWPLPDVDLSLRGSGSSAWVWDFYSPEQLRRRVEGVYEGALRSYERLAQGLFQPLARHLRTWALSPVELVFYLHFREGTGWESQPVGIWHLVPLPEGEDSRVSVSLVDEEPSPEELWAIQADARRTRTDLIERSSSSVVHTLLDVYGKRPITELCYEWLMKDLAEIQWCDRGSPNLH